MTITAVRLLAATRTTTTQRRHRRPATPAELARTLDPNYRVTPAIRLISDIAVRSITQPNQRDAVTTPPRTGKSELLAIYAPAWALMRNPNLRIGIVSYADSLAQEHSRKLRRIVNDHTDLLGYRISADKSAVGRWTIDGHNGGLLAVGIRSGITGHGIDCVAPDTRIVTEYGDVTAERAYTEKHTQIWAYNHTTGMAQWCRVEASRRIDRRDVVTVRTVNGHLLRCTPNHRVYTRRGYVPAGSLTLGDAILTVSSPSGMPPVRKPLPGICDGATESDPQRANPPALLSRLRGPSHRRPTEAANTLRRVLNPAPKGQGRHLLGQMPTPTLDVQAAHRGVRPMRRRLQTTVHTKHLLRPGLRQHRALRQDDRPRQLPLQDRDQLRQLVPAHAATHPATRRALLRRLRTIAAPSALPARRQHRPEVTTRHSPHQRAAAGQPRHQPHHPLHHLPRDTPQIRFDTVSTVEPDSSGPVSVYDFQVEGARNFVANGLLVHNCLIVDDPVKDQSEADSRAYREATYREFQSTLVTRIHPGGSITIVQTRWHPEDLAGRVIAAEPGRWTVTNIPAVADSSTPDALARPAGAAMTSALGFTADDYASLRRTVGERAWQALYQGNPQPAEGGLVKRAWFDQWRLPAAPQNPTRTIVTIDPSDSGSGDFCGIIAASLTRDNVVAFIADKSAPMTADQWATTAVTLAADLGASAIVVEGFSARETYLSVLRKAWERHMRERGTPGRTIRITAWPPKGRARVGDAIARSAALLQALETGTARIAGQLPQFEADACAWQDGQHQPDSFAAAVIGYDELDTGRGRGMGLSGVPGGPKPGPVTPLRPRGPLSPQEEATHRVRQIMRGYG